MPLGRLDHFEVLRLLGRGGWGDVYLARDTRLDCDVALKILHEEFADNPKHRARLQAEARALAQLDHANIVGILDCSEAAPDPPGCLWPGQPGPHPERVTYLAMRFVEGHDLTEEIAGGPLPLERALDYAKQIGRGLAAAHAQGTVHRDLKPGNIRVTPAGVLKILDFGLARSRPTIADSLRTTQSVSREHLAGTLGYICPEMANEGTKLDPRCDLYSYGVIVYELVTGRRPFEGNDLLALFGKIATSEPPPMRRHVRNVPAELERIVRRLLAKDPTQRYGSAQEVVAALEGVHVRTPTPAPAPAERLTGWVTRHRAVVVRAAVVVITATAFALTLPSVLRRVAAPPETVAIPDFENLTGNPAMDRLAIGLGMDLVTSLVQTGRVNVVRPTLRGPDGRPVRDPETLRRTYDVRRVLLGSLRNPDGSGAPGGRDNLGIHLEIVGPDRNRIEWVKDCEATAGDLGGLRGCLVTGVLSRYQLQFEPDAAVAHDLSHERPAAAVEAYLRGLGYFDDPADPAAPDSSLAAFNRALAADSTYGRAYAGRARALNWLFSRAHDESLLVRAEQDARRAVASAPAEIEGRLALARIEQDRGRTGEAVAELQAVLERNPNLAAVQYQLGGAYRKLGAPDKARASFEAALALQPAEPRFWRGYGTFLLLSLADYDGAERAFKKVVELVPDENRGYELLGAAYTLDCRYQEALDAYARRPKQPEISQDARMNRGTAYFFAGRYADALRDYLEVVSMAPEDGNARMSLGDCYVRMGRTEEARAEFRTARQMLERELVANPDDPYLHAALAMSLAKSGDPAGARAEIAGHFPSLAIRDAEVLHTLSKGLALSGERARALAALDTLVHGRNYNRCLLAVEDEYAGLRGDPRFRALVR